MDMLSGSSSPDTDLPTLPDLDAAREAAERGEVLGFSTDTVWGVGVRPENPDAGARLFAHKARPAEKTLQVLCADVVHAARLADLEAIGAPVWAALASFWPGAVTFVVPASPACPAWLTQNGGVGLRVPASDTARAVLLACGGVLAASSLNRSGDPPARTRAEALAANVADLLVPGPPSGNLASTVYDVRARRALREGAVPVAEIEARLP